jgi:hypothetical protein
VPVEHYACSGAEAGHILSRQPVPILEQDAAQVPNLSYFSQTQPTMYAHFDLILISQTKNKTTPFLPTFIKAISVYTQ